MNHVIGRDAISIARDPGFALAMIPNPISDRGALRIDFDTHPNFIQATRRGAIVGFIDQVGVDGLECDRESVPFITAPNANEGFAITSDRFDQKAFELAKGQLPIDRDRAGGEFVPSRFKLLVDAGGQGVTVSNLGLKADSHRPDNVRSQKPEIASDKAIVPAHFASSRPKGLHVISDFIIRASRLGDPIKKKPIEFRAREGVSLAAIEFPIGRPKPWRARQGAGLYGRDESLMKGAPRHVSVPGLAN
jgi:hypothetical protein